MTIAWARRVQRQYRLKNAERVTADYISDIPTLPYKPASPETWEAIRNAKLDTEFGVPTKDKWQEADLPIGSMESDMLRAADTDMIERFGYISHLINTKYPKQYADLLDFRKGRVVIVKPVLAATVEVTPRLLQQVIDWLELQLQSAKEEDDILDLVIVDNRRGTDKLFDVSLSKFLDALNQELLRNACRVTLPLHFLQNLVESMPATVRGAEMAQRFKKNLPEHLFN